MSYVLLLNSDYNPLRVVSWKRALILVYSQKAEIIDTYNRTLRSPSIPIKMPSIIRLLQWVKPRTKGMVRFNKTHLYIRDQGVCQYCGHTVERKRATFDHVVPKSRGGKTDWFNIVTCCRDCNQWKDSSTPEEAGMRLLKQPVAPASLPLHSTVLSLMKENRKEIPESWKNYLRE